MKVKHSHSVELFRFYNVWSLDLHTLPALMLAALWLPSFAPRNTWCCSLVFQTDWKFSERRIWDQMPNCLQFININVGGRINWCKNIQSGNRLGWGVFTGPRKNFPVRSKSSKVWLELGKIPQERKNCLGSMFSQSSIMSLGISEMPVHLVFSLNLLTFRNRKGAALF